MTAIPQNKINQVIENFLSDSKEVTQKQERGDVDVLNFFEKANGGFYAEMLDIKGGCYAKIRSEDAKRMLSMHGVSSAYGDGNLVEVCS